MSIITALLAFLAGDAGKKIGSGISLAAAIAAIAPIAVTLIGHKDELAVSLTWGQLALFAAFAWAMIEVARLSKSPGG